MNASPQNEKTETKHPRRVKTAMPGYARRAKNAYQPKPSVTRRLTPPRPGDYGRQTDWPPPPRATRDADHLKGRKMLSDQQIQQIVRADPALYATIRNCDLSGLRHFCRALLDQPTIWGVVLPIARECLDRELIHIARRFCYGRLYLTASLLGMSAYGLTKLIKRLGLQDISPASPYAKPKLTGIYELPILEGRPGQNARYVGPEAFDHSVLKEKA